MSIRVDTTLGRTLMLLPETVEELGLKRGEKIGPHLTLLAEKEDRARRRAQIAAARCARPAE